MAEIFQNTDLGPKKYFSYLIKFCYFYFTIIIDELLGTFGLLLVAIVVLGVLIVGPTNMKSV